MVKKISNIDSTKSVKNWKDLKHFVKNAKVPKQKPDTFEKQTPKIDDMSNVSFKFQKLKFSPEDEAKMTKMSTKEKIAYVRQLKKEGKYTIENSN